MDTQNTPNPQPSALSSRAILAIISVVLAAGWIAFAFYKGTGNGSRVFLLHPIVPIVLVILLTRVYRHIDLKSIVVLEILMIGVWLFISLLGTLTPFILGFGFAYVLRFLWNMLPFKARYLRGIATVIIVLVCGGLLFYTGQQISKQAGQMASGLWKFYHETALPYVTGETFQAVTIQLEETDDSATRETFYVGTNHGVYEIQQESDRIGITNGPILGKSIQALATGSGVIYAGTKSGLYRYYTDTPEARSDADDTSTEDVAPEIWHKVEATPFDADSVQTVNVPRWDNAHIYVGTQNGLYRSEDSGQSWEAVAPEVYGDWSIVSVTSVVDTAGDRAVYVASQAVGEAESPEGTVAPPSVTRVHWYLEGSSLAWTPLPSPAYPTYALMGGDGAALDSELYAGTVDGLYEWTRFGEWRRVEGPAPITLLASAPSGTYIGDTATVLHHAGAAEGWQPFTTRKEGLSYTYGNEPIVRQVKAYLTERLPAIAQTGSEAIKEGVQFAGSVAFGFGGFVATLALAFIVFVYASQSFDGYFRSFITVVPEAHRETIKTYLREIDRNLQQYLKGQVTVIAMVSVVSCIAYSLIGVPFALVVGLLAGICNAIPTFGPFIGGGFAYIAMLMALAAGDFGMVDFLVRSAFVLGAILGIQMLDNSLISPKIMSSAVDVDPLLIMFAVIVGATVLGFWGVLLAIPIIVVIKSVVAVSQSMSKTSTTRTSEAD